jgi:hypothetical protein
MTTEMMMETTDADALIAGLSDQQLDALEARLAARRRKRDLAEEAQEVAKLQTEEALLDPLRPLRAASDLWRQFTDARPGVAYVEDNEGRCWFADGSVFIRSQPYLAEGPPNNPAELKRRQRIHFQGRARQLEPVYARIQSDAISMQRTMNVCGRTGGLPADITTALNETKNKLRNAITEHDRLADETGYPKFQPKIDMWGML